MLGGVGECISLGNSGRELYVEYVGLWTSALERQSAHACLQPQCYGTMDRRCLCVTRGEGGEQHSLWSAGIYFSLSMRWGVLGCWRPLHIRHRRRAIYTIQNRALRIADLKVRHKRKSSRRLAPTRGDPLHFRPNTTPCPRYRPRRIKLWVSVGHAIG